MASPPGTGLNRTLPPFRVRQALESPGRVSLPAREAEARGVDCVSRAGSKELLSYWFPGLSLATSAKMPWYESF